MCVWLYVCFGGFIESMSEEWGGGGGDGSAQSLNKDDQSPHSAAVSTLLILSAHQFKGTLNGIKDLFKALILIGRGLF